MFTAILGAEKERKVTLSLSRSLKRSGQIVIDSQNTVLQNDSLGDPIKQTKNLTEYIRKESTTSLVVICSATLCSLLAQEDTVTLQINGINTAVNAGTLKQLINEKIKDKIILVTFSAHSPEIPEFFHGCEHLSFTASNREVEISEINIGRLQSALKRRNKELGMHQ